MRGRATAIRTFGASSAPLFASLLWAPLALGQTPGPVSPSSVTYNVVGLSLTAVDGSYVSLDTAPFPATFVRSDPDFAGVPLSDVQLPFGRYTAISVCFDTTVSVLLDGVTYGGPGGALLAHGDAVYSTGGDASQAGAVSNVRPANGASPVMYKIGTEAQNCTAYHLPQITCIDDRASACEAGDRVLLATAIPSGTGDQAALPPPVAGDAGGSDASPTSGEVDVTISLVLDMDNTAVVEADEGTLQSGPELAVTFEKPGAAVHLSGYAMDTALDVSMLFGPNRELLYESAQKWPEMGAGFPGVCSGSSFVAATAAPAGAYLQPDGPTEVDSLDASGTGLLQVVATGACMTMGACASAGINEMSGIFQPVGATASLTCVADSAATPAYLGYTYVGGPGGGGATAQVPIVRVVDPNNLFGICAAGDPHAVANHEGTCSVYAGGDGYP